MSNELLTRGVEEVVPLKIAEEKLKSKKPLRIYFGIDPTGAQLHLGHAIPLRKLRNFADAGHEVILLIGSFTAMIGDPTGKDAMRQPLTRKDIEANFKDYQKQASKILDFKKVTVKYNHEWLEKMTFEDVIALGGEFTVQQLLHRDMYQRRLKADQPIGLHEFFYPLMQGYDSVAMDVDAEIGGSDQLFNMLAGRTLLKNLKQKEKFVITCPLLEGLDGRKMSKTYNNTVNITDEPFEMFGKIMSMGDDLIIKYFRLCTDLSVAEIDAIDQEIKNGANPRDAKMRLAAEIITLYHDAKAAEAAHEQFVNVFKNKGIPDDIPEFKLNGDRNIIDLLELCKLVESRGEAKRAVLQGGVKINDDKITDPQATVHLERDMIVQVGKRRFAKIV